MRNPFQYGRELAPADLVDRQEEIATCVRTVQNRERLFLIGVGLPRHADQNCLLLDVVREMHGATDKAVQVRSVHRGLNAVTPAAAVLPKERETALGETRRLGAARKPAREFGRLHDDDAAVHAGVMSAAIFGAQQVILAR